MTPDDTSGDTPDDRKSADAAPGALLRGAASSEHDVLRTAIGWLHAGHRVVLITVARTWGSSPRPPGSLAAVREDGRLVGSVSGGCIESRLVESLARTTDCGDVGDGRGTTRAAASRVTTHRIDDEVARRAGLTCGGRLELVIEHLHDPSALAPVIAALDERRRVVRRLDTVTREATLASASPADRFDWDGRLLTRVHGPGWRVLLVGAGELSRYVAAFAIALDFEVFVCEPRAAFRDTFDISGARVLDLLPDEAVARHARDARSAVLALSHEPGLDDLALEEALARDGFHIAALGSRRSHAARRRRLAFLGVDEQAMARISAPAGIDIGSRTAAEIGVSIAAELVRARARVRHATHGQSDRPSDDPGDDPGDAS